VSRILIVEDDRDIADLVRLYLERSGHVTELALSGDDVVARVRRDRPDLVILDIMLPGVDGLTICRALRASEATADIPIIILSARVGESDRVHGLELGADDYVTKPFSPKELVARVAALERRTKTREQGPIVRYRDLTLDREKHVISHHDVEVPLTAKEFLLLDYFLRHPGRVLSRERLLTDVWGYHYAGGTRTVDVHVRRLRKKLPILAQALTTVHQFGYKLQDPSTELEPSTPADRRG
jgi:DNA-binding response OmpR family regulator